MPLKDIATTEPSMFGWYRASLSSYLRADLQTPLNYYWTSSTGSLDSGL